MPQKTKIRVFSVWPRFANCDLEEAAKLSGSASWRPLRLPAVAISQRLLTILPTVNQASRFYRLRQRVEPSVLRSEINTANGHTYHLIAGPDGISGLSWTEA